MNSSPVVAARRSLESSPSTQLSVRTFRFPALVVLLAGILSGTVSSAQDSLAKLLPPDAPVLAGMQRSSKDHATDRVWLATAKNLADFTDFISLTASDQTRRFDRLIVAASASGNDPLGDHLLLVEGYFDLAAIDRPAASSITHFHGIPILVLNRTSSSGTEVLWLADLHSTIVLFGSPSAVQKALLRHLSATSADPAVSARLERIPRNDVAWSSITLNPDILKLRLRLNGYEPHVAACLTAATELVFGASFESKTRLDFRVAADSPQDASVSLACLGHLLNQTDRIDVKTRVSASAPIATMSIRVTPEKYSSWVNLIRHHSADILLAAAAPH